MFFRVFIDPWTACVLTLSDGIELLEHTSRDRAGGMRAFEAFLRDGTIGRKFVANADAVCKSRKAEVECEDIVADLEAKAKAVLQSTAFYDQTLGSVCETALELDAVKKFITVAAEAKDKLHELPASKQKAGAQGRTYVQRAADTNLKVWASLKQSFKDMYAAIVKTSWSSRTKVSRTTVPTKTVRFWIWPSWRSWSACVSWSSLRRSSMGRV